jgi:uncharacterized repeat protein (TIGR03943 family)
VTAPVRRIGARRAAQAAILVGWAATFWFLLLTDRTSLYLSSRTAWLVPVGAVLLTAAAIGRLATSRTVDPEPLQVRTLLVTAVMLVPVTVVLSMPPATLGSYAVGRRSGFVGTGRSIEAASLRTGGLSLIDVASAQTTAEGLTALERRAGEQVSFVGFVVREADTPADELLLTRYIVTCCVADATIAQVRVVDVPAGAFAEDEWVRVDGRIYPLGREIIVDASSVEKAPRPQRPYLTP